MQTQNQILKFKTDSKILKIETKLKKFICKRHSKTCRCKECKLAYLEEASIKDSETDN